MKIVLTHFGFPLFSHNPLLMLKTPPEIIQTCRSKKNQPKFGHLQHKLVKGRLIEVLESNTDGMRGGKKLRVIVPAQCTQLSIVQVLRASAITAQLMPVA